MQECGCTIPDRQRCPSLDHAAVALVLIGFLLMPGAGIAAADCELLKRTDDEIQQFDADLSTYTFLNNYWQIFSGYEDYESSVNALRDLNEHRASADGEKYTTICHEEVYGSDLLFCKDFKGTDDRLLVIYNIFRQSFNDQVRATIAGDVDFVALGEGGRPLATNREDFIEAHRTYRIRVAGQRDEIEKKQAWLAEQLAGDPTVHTRCAGLGQ